MIIDYLDKEQMKLWNFRINHEYGRVFVSVAGDFEGVTFRNFPTITTDGTNFMNCTFENTQSVEFSQGDVIHCTFNNVSQISGHYTNFSDSSFVQCCSNGPLLTIDCAGKIEGCSFETITALGEDGYVIYSVYAKKKDVQLIKNCKFLDCRVENEDRLMAYCSYYTRSLLRREKEVDNLDQWSCDLGECVPILIGDF